MYAHLTGHGLLVIYFILMLLGEICFAAAAAGHRLHHPDPATPARFTIGLVPLGLLFVFTVPLIDLVRSL